MKKPSPKRIRMAEEGRILAKMSIDDFMKKANGLEGLDRAQMDLFWKKISDRIHLAEDMGLLKKRIVRPLAAKGIRV